MSSQEDTLRALGAKAECPVCGGEEWEDMGVSTKETLMLPTELRDEEEETGWAYRVVGIFCLTCGFIRLHNIEGLDLEPPSGQD